MTRILVLVLAASVLLQKAAADAIYQQPADFIQQAFNGKSPMPRKLWITGDLRDQATAILGHAPAALRISYWPEKHKTAWILEEIGKEQPITAGIVVDNGRIATVRVLIFRESRGWEIRYPFFTDQFTGIKLEHGDRLDRKIDGISGATLSVNAIEKLTRLALLYHQQVSAGE